LDGPEDLFGGLGPDEGFGVVVPGGGPGADVAFEGLHAAVVAALDELSGQFGEPPLDLVDPAGIAWGVVHVEARLFGERALDGGRIVVP
jgi:hypothetical protein